MGREYRVRDFNEMQSRQRDGIAGGYNSFCLPIPCCYIHTTSEMANDEDVEGTGRDGSDKAA